MVRRVAIKFIIWAKVAGVDREARRKAALRDKDKAAAAAMVLFAGVASSLKRCAF
jgi:hypothetical protein